MRTAFLIVLMAIVAMTVISHMRRRRSSRPPPPKERYAQETSRVRASAGAARTYAVPHVPAPPTENSPLAPYLAAAVDGTVPTEAPGESVPFSKDEVRDLLNRVVSKINGLHPGLDLALVHFENVRKVVDAYKTVRYEADVQVHSVPRMFSSRMTVKAEVSAAGRLYVRSLGVHNARPDTSPVGAGDFGQLYAEFEPAIRFPVAMK